MSYSDFIQRKIREADTDNSGKMEFDESLLGRAIKNIYDKVREKKNKEFINPLISTYEGEPPEEEVVLPERTKSPILKTADISQPRTKQVIQDQEKANIKNFPSIVGSLPNRTVKDPNDDIKLAIMRAFPQEEWENASRVAFLESSHNPKGYNWNPPVPERGIKASEDYGLFQINSIHFPRLVKEGFVKDGDKEYIAEQLKDPFLNALVARNIYDRAGGWSPWSATSIEGAVRSNKKDKNSL